MSSQLLADIKNYEYQRTEAGEAIAISRSTGETIPAVSVLQPAGSWVNTPAQQEKHKRQLFRKQNPFVFVREQDYSDISPESLTRLIFLNTFANYNDNKLMISERAPMHKKDLAKILGVSSATAFRFWREVSPGYLQEDAGGLILTDRAIFYKGDLRSVDHNSLYRRLYIKGVRTLYRSISDTKYVKHLGYIFRLLPFINLEYNILCYNPSETNIEDIQPITLSEFCSLIHYNYENVDKLLNIYRRIRFEVPDKPNKTERFISFVSDGISRGKSCIIVNPRILFNGSDYSKVEALGLFYKD